MKCTLEFDPGEHSYGPATAAVRDLLRAWADIDWFVPKPGRAAEAEALRVFESHQALCHLYAPALFAARPRVTSLLGSWADFQRLTTEVRTRPGWDWKFAGLKPMLRAHSKSRGWKLHDAARALQPASTPSPGQLFVVVGEATIWMQPTVKDLRPFVPQASAEVAEWYVSYARGDVVEGLEWQLAQASEDLSTNPFHPLLQCYAAGRYPFFHTASEATLFAFRE